MVNLGVCCASLKDNKALMKMGLGLVLVGHVNFLLGALVHGAVLRLVSVHPLPVRTRTYAIANIIALVAGLVGITAGITAIVLSKNKKNRILKWVLLVLSFIAGLLATASMVGLSVSVVNAIVNRGRSLLAHCKFPDVIDFSSVTNECPFDPTRIYGTTVILWVPLIIMSVVEAVFSGRCFVACTSFLRICPCRKRPINARRVRIRTPDQRSRTPDQRSPPPRPEPQSEPEPETEEEEPAERHELLDSHPPAEQSDWV